jgi:hypothetical protein
MGAFIRDMKNEARLLPILLAVALCACERQESDDTKKNQPSPTPQRAVTSAPAESVARATAAPTTSPAATVEGVPVNAVPEKPGTNGTDEDPDDTPQGALSQLSRYFATNDADERAEIITTLQGMTVPEAAQTISRIIPSESDPDLKAQLIGVLADAEASVELKLNTFAPLVREGQQADVRQAAIDALDQIDDPQAIPIWQSLLNDKDEEIRASAEDALSRLK